MSKAFIGHSMDKVILLANKETGHKQGRILAYWTNSGTCHALVEFYCGNAYNGEYFSSVGKAGGYGYDKFSAAVSDALRKGGLGNTHEKINNWAFHHGEAGLNRASNEELADYEKAIIEEKIIPVYAGAGNVNEAFNLYFNVINVL